MDWGNPETWSNFWAVVGREQYAFMYDEYPRSFTRYLRQLWDMAVLWGDEFTPPVAALGVLGLAALIRLRRWEGTLIMLVAILVPASAAWVQNFEHDLEWLSVMRVFGIPAYWATAVGLGCGLAWLAARRVWTARVLAVLCVAVPLTMHWQRNDHTKDFWAKTYALHLLDLLPENALYIPETDQSTFPVLYLQVVEGLRPDVTLGRKYGYLDESVINELPEAQRQAIGEFPRAHEEAAILDALLRHTDRPVYFERPPRPPADGAWRFVPHGFLFRAVKAGEAWSGGDPWTFYDWGTHPPEDGRQTYEASLILFTYGLAKARDALLEGDTQEAERRTTYALDAYGREPKSLNAAGVVWAKARQWTRARSYFDAALAMDSTYAPAQNNLRQLNSLE
jgi:hypothetical protein